MIGDHSDCHLWFAACVSETGCHHLLSVMCMSGCELAVMCCRLVAVCSDYVHAVAVCSAYVRYICAAIILFVRWSGIIQVVIFYLRHVCQRRIVAIYHLWCAYQAVMCCNCVQRLCSCYNNIEICCVRGFTRFCVEEIRCRLVSWSERLEIDKVLHDKTGKPQMTSHSDAAIDNINSKLQPLTSTDFFSQLRCFFSTNIGLT